MANDRDCENCIHKVNGACNVWECKFEPKNGTWIPDSEQLTKEEQALLIKRLKDILAEATETDNAVCYVTADDADTLKAAIKELEQKPKWIPVSERLPELNRPLLVTSYHRVYYGHLISESGNYGYPVFRIHGLGDKNRDWVQETMSHEPYSLGRIDAWMYLDIPEPYKVEPQESEDKE